MIARNALWNWAGIVTTMGVGFLVAPFLVHRLGETTYGLWILIASFTNYFGLLDLGLRVSVSRQIAYHRAQGNHEEVCNTLSTALAYLCGAGLAALLGTLVVMLIFFELVDVPADQAGGVRVALLLVGLNLALYLPLNVFDATLWAASRFDLLNAVDIPITLLRAVLTFWLISSGHGIVALAVINILSLAGAQAVKMLISLRLDRSLRLGIHNVRLSTGRQLFGFGLWCVVLSLTVMVNTQLAPLIIGVFLGVPLVTVHSIAVRLVAYVHSLISAATEVLMPIATMLEADRNHRDQQRFFLEGGKYCTVLALFFVSALIFLGRPLVVLWMGPSLESAATLLLILALGEALSLTQLATKSMVLGMGRHKPLACLGVVDNVSAAVAAVLLGQSHGIFGVCLAFAVSAALFRGVGQLVYGCRVIGVPMREYLRRAFLPPLATASVPALLLGLAVSWHAPTTWLELFCYGFAYVIIYSLSSGLLVGYRYCWRFVSEVSRGTRSSSSSQPAPSASEGPKLLAGARGWSATNSLREG